MQNYRALSSNIKILCLTLLLSYGPQLRGQSIFNYISPGLQIGHSSGLGTFISTQITDGALGDAYNGFPGLTLGLRSQENRRTLFLDAQLSLVTIGYLINGSAIGGGAGMAFIYTKSEDGSYRLSKTGARLNGIAGFFGLATLDLLFVPNQTAGINIGLMGVLPMLLDASIGI